MKFNFFKIAFIAQIFLLGIILPTEVFAGSCGCTAAEISTNVPKALIPASYVDQAPKMCSSYGGTFNADTFICLKPTITVSAGSESECKKNEDESVIKTKLSIPKEFAAAVNVTGISCVYSENAVPLKGPAEAKKANIVGGGCDNSSTYQTCFYNPGIPDGPSYFEYTKCSNNPLINPNDLAEKKSSWSGTGTKMDAAFLSAFSDDSDLKKNIASGLTQVVVTTKAKGPNYYGVSCTDGKQFGDCDHMAGVCGPCDPSNSQCLDGIAQCGAKQCAIPNSVFGLAGAGGNNNNNGGNIPANNNNAPSNIDYSGSGNAGGGSINLINPLAKTISLDSPVQSLAARLINVMFGISGSIALFMFVLGGFLWLTSAGNQDRVKQGRDIFQWSSLGLIIMFSSYVVVQYLFGTLLADYGTSGNANDVPGAVTDPGAFTGGGGNVSGGNAPIGGGAKTPPPIPPPQAPPKGNVSDLPFCCVAPDFQKDITAKDKPTASDKCAGYVNIKNSNYKTIKYISGTCSESTFCLDDATKTCEFVHKIICDADHTYSQYNSCKTAAAK